MTGPEDQVEYMLSNSIEASSKSPFHLIYCKVTFWPKCWIVVGQNDFQVLCDTPAGVAQVHVGVDHARADLRPHEPIH